MPIGLPQMGFHVLYPTMVSKISFGPIFGFQISINRNIKTPHVMSAWTFFTFRVLLLKITSQNQFRAQIEFRFAQELIQHQTENLDRILKQTADGTAVSCFSGLNTSYEVPVPSRSLKVIWREAVGADQRVYLLHDLLRLIV